MIEAEPTRPQGSAPPAPAPLTDPEEGLSCHHSAAHLERESDMNSKSTLTVMMLALLIGCGGGETTTPEPATEPATAPVVEATPAPAADDDVDGLVDEAPRRLRIVLTQIH